MKNISHLTIELIHDYPLLAKREHEIVLSRKLQKRSKQPARNIKQRFRELVWQVLSSRLEGDILEGQPLRQTGGKWECSWDKRPREPLRKP